MEKEEVAEESIRRETESEVETTLPDAQSLQSDAETPNGMLINSTDASLENAPPRDASLLGSLPHGRGSVQDNAGEIFTASDVQKGPDGLLASAAPQELPSRDREGAFAQFDFQHTETVGVGIPESEITATHPELPQAEPEQTQGEQLFIVAVPDFEASGESKLKAVLEAAIYVTEEPLSLAQISAAIQQPIDVVKRVMADLANDYAREDRGLTIREVAGGFKMATKPEHHEAIRTFVKNLKPPLKLSLPALETLAVIAYKQPITAPEIMEIRGVQGAGVLKTLLDRKLIATGGRKQVVGKPILYKTTKEFLLQFGLKDLSELPTLKEFEELGRMAMSDNIPDPSDSPPVQEPEPAPSPIEEPEHPGDPGPAEDPQEQPVKAGA